MSTLAEYTAHLKALLPRGSAWPRGQDTVLHHLLEALALELQRAHVRIFSLIAEADPHTTGELLGDWEHAVGLPDPCVTAPLSTTQRRAALLARLTATGGASHAYFIAIAESLGYVDPGIDEPALHVWRLNLHEGENITWARAGQSRAGDPIRSWGNEQLECLIHRLKPAHTRVLFAYGVP